MKGVQQTALESTDALILTEPELVGVIFTADCLPVILYDTKHNIGAVIHAGWKGMAGGIIPGTLKRMRDELDCSEADTIAVTGPGIRSCCYQVDTPVFRKMTENYPETLDAFTPDGQDHWRFSLEDAAKAQLITSGVSPLKIETAGLCTCCHEDFYSWRGDGPGTGRIGTFLSVKSLRQSK